MFLLLNDQMKEIVRTGMVDVGDNIQSSVFLERLGVLSDPAASLSLL